jgi:hypothetical protein
MDNENAEKQRQKRGRGKCWGCGREGVEWDSSVWLTNSNAGQLAEEASQKAVV